MPQASAFQFFAKIDGLALTTQGLVFEWNGITTLPVSYLITPLGLATHGLAVGMGDFWQYAETISNANWAYADL